MKFLVRCDSCGKIEFDYTAYGKCLKCLNCGNDLFITDLFEEIKENQEITITKW